MYAADHDSRSGRLHVLQDFLSRCVLPNEDWVSLYAKPRRRKPAPQRVMTILPVMLLLLKRNQLPLSFRLVDEGK